MRGVRSVRRRGEGLEGVCGVWDSDEDSLLREEEEGVGWRPSRERREVLRGFV